MDGVMAGMDNVRKSSNFLVSLALPRQSIRRLSFAGSLLLMAVSPACSAHSGAAANRIDLQCSVKGAVLLAPAMSSDAVCALFHGSIEQALPDISVTMNSASSPPLTDWIRVEVRFSKPGTASAMVMQSEAGRQIVHPEIAVDVMDKPLGDAQVRLLAKEVAGLLSQGKAG